jgi:enoyl-CoA hydratase/carnithine racemase
LHDALDEVEKEDNMRGKVMVTVSTHPKIFSNGLDIENLNTKQDVHRTLDLFESFCHRMLNSQIPTIACVNGHAFAGGWFMAIAHHYRIMNADKGWICLNEIELGVPIPSAFTKLGVLKIGHHNYWEAASIGERYSGKEALERKIAQKIFEADKIMEKTEEFAEHLASKKLDPVAFMIHSEEIFSKGLVNLAHHEVKDITLERIANYKSK